MRVLLVVLVAAIAGCGAKSFDSVTVEPLPAVPAAQKAKTLLEEVAKTGELGSGAEEIKMTLEELKSADVAKGDELLKDMQQLEAARDPSAIKSKAKAMADKL
jgi:hypothetical protein